MKRQANLFLAGALQVAQKVSLQLSPVTRSLLSNGTSYESSVLAFLLDMFAILLVQPRSGGFFITSNCKLFQLKDARLQKSVPGLIRPIQAEALA